MNQGDDWTAISPDLTQGGKEGNVAYGTLSSISESPFQFGLIYTGSDDGLVQITKDSGASWNSIKGDWPANLWVSRVVSSQHKKNVFMSPLTVIDLTILLPTFIKVMIMDRPGNL